MARLLLALGLIGLCHAAYSATQHRNYLRLTESDFTALPGDILVETFLSLLACCFGIISISTKFKPIQITSEWENKTWDNVANRTSFYSFNHRGKFLFSDNSETRTTAADLAREYLQTKSKLNDKEKREKQNELIRQRIAEAYKESSSSESQASSEHEDADEENSSEQ